MSQMDAKRHKAIDTEQKNAEKRYQDLEEKFRDLEIRYHVLELKAQIDQLRKVRYRSFFGKWPFSIWIFPSNKSACAAKKKTLLAIIQK